MSEVSVLVQRRRGGRAPLLVLLHTLVVLALGGALPSTALAQPSPEETAGSGTVAWGVRPADNQHGADRPNFSYDVAAGGTISDAIVVTNYSDEAITLAVYGADGFLNSAGEIDVRPAAEESTELGSWITTAQEEVTIEPGAGARIPFRITVPPTTPPGDVVGAVLTSLRTESDAAGLAVDRRLGSRVVLRVDGELQPQLDLTNLVVDYDGHPLPWVGGTTTVSYTLRNTGNITLEGTDGLVLSGPFGLGRTEGGGGSFPPLPPGSELEREIVLEGVAPLVLLSGEVQVTGVNADLDPDLQRQRAVSLWAVPWLLVVVVVLFVGAIVVARVRRRARKRAEDRRVTAAVEAALAQHVADDPSGASATSPDVAEGAAHSH